MTWCWCAPAAGRCCARAPWAAMPLLLLGPARQGRKSRKAAQTAVRRHWWLHCHPLQLPGRSHGLHGAFPAAQLRLLLLYGRGGIANDCCWCTRCGAVRCGNGRGATVTGANVDGGATAHGAARRIATVVAALLLDRVIPSILCLHLTDDEPDDTADAAGCGPKAASTVGNAPYHTA